MSFTEGNYVLERNANIHIIIVLEFMNYRVECQDTAISYHYGKCAIMSRQGLNHDCDFSVLQ